MRKLRWGAVAVFVAALLVGCAGGDADEPVASADADADADVDPAAGSVTEALSWLPDSIQGAEVLDVERAATEFAVERPGRDADPADLQALVTAMAERGVVIGSWWRGATPEDLRAAYGFDHGDIDRIAATPLAAGQDGAVLVAEGRFSPAAVAEAAASHADAGDEVRRGTFDGVEHHVVGDDEGIRQSRERMGPARPLGRGFTIGVVDDRLVLTSSAAAMEEAIGTLRGDRPDFLGADDRHATLAARADELGLAHAWVGLRPVVGVTGERVVAPDVVEHVAVVDVGADAGDEARDAFVEAVWDPELVGDAYGDVSVEVDGRLVIVWGTPPAATFEGNRLLSVVGPFCEVRAGQPDGPCVLPPGL